MEQGWRKIARVIAALVGAAGALWQLSLLVRLWAGRLRYAWDIEWLESTVLYQAYRVMKGLPTYGPPRDGYLPINHPPLFPATLGMLGRVVGLDYSTARTFLLLCFLGASALVLRAMVRRLDGRVEGWALGVMAAGVAATGVPLCESMYDVVREDSMAVLLCTVLAVLVDGPPRLSPRRIAVVASLVTAIVYTRTPAVFFPVWVTAFVFVRHRRSGLMLALVATALCGVVLVGLQFNSKGWFWMHIVGFVQGQDVRRERFVQGLKMLVELSPFLVGVPVVLGALLLTRRLTATGALWAGMLAASIPASLLPFAKVGGFANDFIPILFFMGAGTAALLADAFDALSGRPRVALATSMVVLVAGSAFLFRRTWDVKRWIPSEDTFKRAQALNERVSKLEGGVIAPRHPFLPARNGDPTPQWSDMPYLDLIWAGYSDIDLGRYIDKGHAKWVLVNGTEIGTTSRELSVRYQLAERIANAPSTLIGEHSSTRYLLRANEEEKNARVLFDFESLDGWTMTGDAFIITSARPAGQLPINGVVGKMIANSYHPKGRDPARGTMVSPRFVIDRPHMSLRVGGGWRSGTRVELRVGGRTERTATGIWEYQETMTRVVWDVRALQGKEAQLHLIDEDAGSWAHLLCDHVVLY